VVIGIDDTIERRWGRKISARGVYRDPVRSSKGHFVKTSGLRWLSAQLLVQIPWAGRIMGLPFLTVLAPSKRFYADKPRSPKTLLDCARQVALQIHRWLPGRRIVIVGDTAFAAIDFLGAVRNYVSVVTRLRLDANLYAPVPPRRPGRGRPPVKGKRLPTLTQVLHDAGTSWQRHTVALWYGRTNRVVEIATGTAVWYRGGLSPVPIRWLLVRDPLGELPPQTFLCTDLDATPVDILQWFVSRWQLEVTFDDFPYCTPSYAIEKTESVDWDYTIAESLGEVTLSETWQRQPSEAPKEHSNRPELPADALAGSYATPLNL
jgi:hypothetical protein